LPCPMVFVLVIGIDSLQKHLDGGAFLNGALDILGNCGALILWILLLGFMPLNIILTLIGIGTSPRSKLSWIALFIAVLPLLIYACLAYMHHLKQQ